MKAIINTCDWGSTGKIAIGLCNYLKLQGKEVLFCYGRGEKRDDAERFRFSKETEVKIHYAHNKLTGFKNGSSKSATIRLIDRLRDKNVKEIYIVNLHGYVLNEELFLNYLVSDDIHVVYIMADESAFLGNCTYRNGCDRYLEGCKQCGKIRGIQKLFGLHPSEKAFEVKSKAYKNLKNIVFVGPEFVIQSAITSPLLKDKRTEIVDEAIDVRINSPRDTSELREKLGLSEDKIVIVCVAPFSYPRKGVRYFVETAKRLENDGRYAFVQVGYDVKDKTGLPKNYIPIEYVSNQKDLTEYYSLSDLFVFPSLQDTMPKACLEALACGSPLLCFNTSGMPYMADETVMTLVEVKNVDQMVEVILHTNKKDETVINTCRNYALKRFDNQNYFKKLETIMNSMNNN